ncbi:MAG TPA: ATP-binding protein [Bacteriovoracaceae bacterium]|nr:ATP-binding protein [Bacteriovoracaceae bacterium]
MKKCKISVVPNEFFLYTYCVESITSISNKSECHLYERIEELEKREINRTKQLRSLSVELSMIEERQRRSIASDLHDHVGQALAIVKFKIQELQGNNIFDPFCETLGELETLVEQIIRYTRSLTIELAPPILYELGIDAAIEWLCSQTKKKHKKLKFIIKNDKTIKHLTDDVKIILFRSVSEIIQNIIKHANATHVIIETKQENGQIVITISDNGQGFGPSKIETNSNKTFGLFSIRERINYLEGTFKIESRNGAGTKILMAVDLENKVDRI